MDFGAFVRRAHQSLWFWKRFPACLLLHLSFILPVLFLSQHHCRNCGDIFCDKCTHGRIALTAGENAQPVRVCDRCMVQVPTSGSETTECGVCHHPFLVSSH